MLALAEVLGTYLVGTVLAFSVATKLNGGRFGSVYAFLIQLGGAHAASFAIDLVRLAATSNELAWNAIAVPACSWSVIACTAYIVARRASESPVALATPYGLHAFMAAYAAVNHIDLLPITVAMFALWATLYWSPSLGAYASRTINLAKYQVWRASEHSDEENTHWSWLRAVEWISWPVFVSQPIMPTLLWLYPMQWGKLVIGLMALSLLWQLAVSSRRVSVWLAGLGSLFVHLKWIVCPLAACLLWNDGYSYQAVGALLWPFLTGFLAPLRVISIGIGPVQNRFMVRLGYTHTPG
jgi:hypothetical protein